VAYNQLVNGKFGVVDAADGYVLLKRGAPGRNLPDAFFAPFRAAGPTPQVPLQVDFDGKVRLLGVDVLTDQYGRGYVRTYWERLTALDRNYVLFPFAADAQGAPVPDLNFPMTALFWYPSAAWKKNEVVVAKTVPVEWGDRVRLGVGVSTSFDWGDANARLDVTGVEPSTLPVLAGTWVDLGTWTREGGGYRK
jgi:hypothetical protein